MANRRMFSKDVIDNDLFMEMPLTTQALYFHLGMRADDDGFIDNPKTIQKMVGATADDLKLLHAKGYVIPFESGVIVITHWGLHNSIRKDRHKPTIYQSEKALLNQSESGVYLLNGNQVTTKCQPLVEQMEPQVRLGKVSIDKESINTLSCEIVDEYNRICVSLPKVSKMTEKRKRQISARMKTYSKEQLIEAFTKAERSEFLTGKSTGFKCSFDWLMNENNLIKVIEGNYDNKQQEGIQSVGSAMVDRQLAELLGKEQQDSK